MVIEAGQPERIEDMPARGNTATVPTPSGPSNCSMRASMRPRSEIY
jgi:hypothetical protein